MIHQQFWSFVILIFCDLGLKIVHVSVLTMVELAGIRISLLRRFYQICFCHRFLGHRSRLDCCASSSGSEMIGLWLASQICGTITVKGTSNMTTYSLASATPRASESFKLDVSEESSESSSFEALAGG
nr:hypothetical protein Iba_chr10dCG13070 [Ipomoea batatas]